MDKVCGNLSVSIHFECPKCGEYLDAFNDEETNIVNDEGQLWDIIKRSRAIDGWKNLAIEAKCFKCNHEFLFDEMEY